VMWSLHGMAIHVCLEFASNARSTVAITIGSRSSDDTEECGRVLMQLRPAHGRVRGERFIWEHSKSIKCITGSSLTLLTFRVVVIRGARIYRLRWRHRDTIGFFMGIPRTCQLPLHRISHVADRRQPPCLDDSHPRRTPPCLEPPHLDKRLLANVALPRAAPLP
jgi:hypothetical protein